ncbi:hypothetical protein VF13_38230, partial [Nostoc linckia z16]
MKTPILLRILCGLSFLILFCPFFQMCADKRHVLSKPVEIHAGQQSSNGYATDVKEFFIDKHTYNSKDTILSGYEIAFALTYSEAWYLGGSFGFIILFSIIMLLKVMYKKYKHLQTLSLLNIFLLLIFLSMLISSNLFEDINQI